MSLDEGQTHTMCGYKGCTHCHCHWCVMQEREVNRQAVQALMDERDKWKVECDLRRERKIALEDCERREAAALDEVRRLRAAPEHYSRHDDNCHAFIANGPCTCGLDDALSP